MVTTKASNSIERFLNFFKSRNLKKIESKEIKKTFADSSQEHLFSDYVGNDILISSSGQVKIDNLVSCLSLVSSDFVVF